MKSSMTLKRNIVRLMYENGINQADLAKKAKLTEASISRYINGTRFPSSKSMLKLSKALNCSIDDLVNEKIDYESEFERIIKKAFSSLTESERNFLISKLKKEKGME